MRRRLIVLSIIALAGCNRFSGPLESRQMGRADAPGYDVPDQKQRGRERYAISEDDPRIGPKGYIDRPSPIGR